MADTNKFIEEARTLEERKSLNREISELVPKWRDAGFLEGLRDDYQAEQMALILENQSLYNDIMRPQDLENRDLMISLVHKIFKDFIGFDIISVQTMLGPSGRCYYVKFAENEQRLVSESVDAVTKKFKCVHRDGEYSKLTEENVPKLAKLFREEILRGIFKDLDSVVATVSINPGNIPSWEKLYGKIGEIFTIIHRKSSINPIWAPLNWIVTSLEVADQIFSANKYGCDIQEVDKDSICYYAKIGDWKLFIDPLYPKNEMLLGYYSHFCTGYVYSPYVPIAITPTIFDPNFCPRQGYLTRFGKRLTYGGGGYYARLKYDISS